MKYRPFGATTESVSVLGLDISSLPRTNASEIETSGALVREAIDGGVDYLDLGPADYNGRYDHINALLCTALRDGYRDRVTIAAHLPAAMLGGSAGLDYFLDQLGTSLTDVGFDCWIVDGLNRKSWPVLRDRNIVAQLETALAGGRITKLGFSYRDQFHYLRLMLEDYAGWDLVQINYNYLDVDRQPGISGVRHIRDLGMAVAITDPLHGGLLAAPPPESVAAIWAGAGYDRTLTEWALRGVWNHAEVTTVICKINSSEQLYVALDIADRAAADSLGVREQILVNQVRDAYRKLRPIPCNTCRTCMPCPQDIDVPRILELYNDAVMFDDPAAARTVYRDEGHSLADCDECGACARHCGRMIAILEWLKKADDLLGTRVQVS